MILLLVAGFVAFFWVVPEYYSPVFLIAALFFYVFTLLIHAWQLNSAKKSLAEFTRSNMIAMFVKLMVYLAFTITILAISKKNAIAFVVVIMVLYISFTVAEVTSLAKFSRPRDKKTEN